MDGFESFNEETQRAKVAKGFKGGPFNASPNLAPKMTFANGVASESEMKLQAAGEASGNVIDPWGARKSSK